MSIYKGETLISGNTNVTQIPDDGYFIETIDLNDQNGVDIYSEHVRKNASTGLNSRIWRVFGFNGVSDDDKDNYSELYVNTSDTTATWNFTSRKLATTVYVNEKPLATVDQIPTKLSEFNNDSGFSVIKKEEISGTLSNYGLLTVPNWYNKKELISIAKSSDTSFSTIIRAIPIFRADSNNLYIQCFNWQTGELLTSGTIVKLSVLYIDK